MKKWQLVLIILNLFFIAEANAQECSTIIYRKAENRSQYNTPTLKALELQEYANEYSEKYYYPFPLSRAKSQQYLTQLLAENPASAFNPVVFTNAIAACDYTTIERYIKHGLTLQCYNQEGASNILNWFRNCRHRSTSLAERNKALENVLKVGADPNQGNKDLSSMGAGRYPLTQAIEACDTSMLDILLKYGANPNFKTKGEDYFPILNICGTERNYNNIGTAADLHFPPAEPMPLAHVMESLLKYGADPNTIYISNDRRNLATQDKAKVLAMACSGNDSQAKSLYDFYAKELEQAKIEGDPIQIDNFEKLFEVIVKAKAKPLNELCHTLN